MRRLSGLLFGLLTISLCYATPWTGGTSEPTYDGTTYTIATPEELAWVAAASQTDNFAGKIIRLTDDIDLGGTQATPPSWIPIGSNAVPFQGELDGNIHVVYNLYMLSSSFPQGAGLVAETGADAVIHHLGIAQGQIMTDGSNNVGSFVGVNRGTIHHCFNMLQIIAHNGDNIGGLVGSNYGSISYAYNVGIITDGNNHVGGLIGYNQASAVLDNCYNIGYCKGTDRVGALFGKNEAPESQLTKVVFDQQLTRMYATGYGTNDPILTDNTKYAIEKSQDFWLHGPYYQNPEVEWCSDVHAQLVCFKYHPASWLSGFAVSLDADNRPIERAEGVGAPKEGNEPRNTITLDLLYNNYGYGEWYSPNPDVIYIASPSSSRAQVSRPCGNQEVILTQTFGNFVKQVYTIVKGYDVFDAGVVSGETWACWNQEDVKFMAQNNGGKEASGGKDDEQKNSTYSYQYMIIRDTVISRDQGIYEPLDTFYMAQEAYKDWCMRTDVPGDYAFRRYVKDYKCKTEWTASKGSNNESVGRLYLHVREKFDPGELVEEPDTLYGELPLVLTIESARDASGGGGHYKYTWVMIRNAWDPEAQDWMAPGEDDMKNPLYIGGTPVSTASFDYNFTKPGMYSFTRKVSETSCEATPIESLRPHIVVVYAAIDAGSIDSFERQLCTPMCSDTINELAAASGGNGIYSYRWLCNGSPIPNSDSTALVLENFQMESDKTYIFQRQVKDNTGLMDWQTSAGEVRVRIFKEYKAGAIQTIDEQVCTDNLQVDEVLMDIHEANAASGETGSEFVYCWLLYRGGADTLLLDTIDHNAPTLDTAISLSSYGLSVPVTIFVKRAVQNLLCQTEWKQSDNTAMWRFGQSETATIAVKACHLPYMYTYTFSNGSTAQYQFTEANETTQMNDETEEGCPLTVTVRCMVTLAPEVNVEPVVSVCETASTMRIAYTVTGGAPDHFDLTFSESAKEIGFRDSLDVEMPAARVIEIPVPTSMPIGKHSFTISFFAQTAESDECKRSEEMTIPFSIDLDGFVHRKENEVVFVDNSGKHNDEGLTFVSYQWYRNNEPLENATGQFYYEYNGLNGYYQVAMVGADGKEYRSCIYEYRPTTPIQETKAEGQTIKVLRNGRLLLIVGDKIYNVMGQEEK
jgi:hypothetical protein